jgi:thioredoxin 1
MVLEITDQNFEDEVLKSGSPMVVDFWAPWCAPCNLISPMTEKLSKKFEGKFKFCRLNVDENRPTVMEYEVMNIPVLLFFRYGQLIDSSVGVVPEKTIQSRVEALL